MKVMATKKKGRETDSTETEATTGTDKDGSGGSSSTKAAPREPAGRASRGHEAPVKKRQDNDGGLMDEAPAKKKKEEQEEGGLLETLRQYKQFLHEVYIEFGKISWPSRRQVFQETYSVLFLVTLITVMVLGFDWVIGKYVFGPLGEWTRHLGGG